MEQKRNNQRATFSVVCYLRKSTVLKNGEVPVYMRITVNGQSVFLSMQGSVDPSLWNQSKEKSRGKDRKTHELNLYIDAVKSKLCQIYRDLEIEGKPTSAQIVKDIFQGKATHHNGSEHYGTTCDPNICTDASHSHNTTCRC